MESIQDLQGSKMEKLFQAMMIYIGVMIVALIIHSMHKVVSYILREVRAED